VVPDRAPLVHLVGYGDTAPDLAADATVTVAMDTPYLLASAPSPVLLATYSSSRASMVALAAVLAGQAPAPGRSPVPLD
jgi:beta-N-acetylhexosaminidase